MGALIYRRPALFIPQTRAALTNSPNRFPLRAVQCTVNTDPGPADAIHYSSPPRWQRRCGRRVMTAGPQGYTAQHCTAPNYLNYLNYLNYSNYSNYSQIFVLFELFANICTIRIRIRQEKSSEYYSYSYSSKKIGTNNIRICIRRQKRYSPHSDT